MNLKFISLNASDIKQITDQAAQLKTFMEHVTLKDIAISLRAQIRALDRLKAKAVIQELPKRA